MINDADRTVEELIGELTVLKQDFWKYLDLAAGMILGLYQPYLERARAYDCNSRFLSFCIELINYSTLTDPNWFKGFKDPFSIAYLILLTLAEVFNLFILVDTCADQYAFSANLWLSKMATSLTISTYGYDGFYDTI